MILWIVLFGLVVVASFLLALQSMRDYQEIPKKDEYSLFLIRNSAALTSGFLDSFQKTLNGQVLSFERLIKGGQSALVVYGPRNLLLSQRQMLDLLELEDYVRVNNKQISSWEVVDHKKIFQSLPALSTTEQFWWQLLLSPKNNKYLGQIRVMVVSKDAERRRLVSERLNRLPKAFSNAQLLDFYSKRILRNDPNNLSLSSEEVVDLIRL